jgi:hypothetical protein
MEHSTYCISPQQGGKYRVTLSSSAGDVSRPVEMSRTVLERFLRNRRLAVRAEDLLARLDEGDIVEFSETGDHGNGMPGNQSPSQAPNPRNGST